MKHIADRGYTDVQLNRHVDKDEELEKIYDEAGVKLTEERINYLVNERKLYITVEEIPEDKIDNITTVDEIPEGETVIDRVDIVEESNEEEKQKENESEEVEEDKEEATEVEVEEVKVKEDKEVVEDKTNEEEITEEETKKNTTKSKTKNTKKDDEK